MHGLRKLNSRPLSSNKIKKGGKQNNPEWLLACLPSQANVDIPSFWRTPDHQVCIPFAYSTSACWKEYVEMYESGRL